MKGWISTQEKALITINGKTLFWLSLDKCQVPTKTALSLSLLSWTGERKYDERVEIRTGGDHSPITVMGKTD